MKLKNVLYFILIFITLGILIISIIYFLYPLKFVPEEIKYCKSDLNCIVVQDGPCDCNHMGKNTAINKNYEDYWNQRIEILSIGVGCLAAISNDITCFSPIKCINNECVIDTNDLSLCKKKREPDYCYFQFATQKLNATLCKKISGEYFYTIELCINEIIRRTGDIEFCSEHPSEKDCRNKFFLNNAVSKKEIGECYNIIDDDKLTDKCIFKITQISGELNDCKIINDIRIKDECFFEIITNTEELAKCDYIENITLRDMCFSKIYFSLAKKDMNYELCFKIIKEDFIPIDYSKINCFIEMALLTGNIDLCENLEKDSFFYHSCIEKVIREHSYYELCEKIYRKDSCLREIAVEGSLDFETSIKACKKIEIIKEPEEIERRISIEIKDRCIFEVSIRFSNDKYCSEITTKLYHLPEESEEWIETNLSDECFEKAR